MITKVAIKPGIRRHFQLHRNARGAFARYLSETKHEAGDVVLLPAYIGWSSREGSGVFDPIVQLGLRPEFYRVDGRLRLDLNHLSETMLRNKAKTLVLIHYFGYVDAAYEPAVALARSAGLRIIEDEAHAMLSDLVGGACGRLGDACVYSLHKLLPVPAGGVLVRNGVHPEDDNAHILWTHDLADISRRRRDNVSMLSELLSELHDDLVPLFGNPGDGTVPQTFPIRLLSANRDYVYKDLNRDGFGVVSLYHTLIEPLNRPEFAESIDLSRCVLNLPVHQDATPEDMRALVARLKASVEKNRQ